MANRTTAKRPRRRRLTKERVLRAAVALADQGGIEALSMRRLGQELGVEAMSLYNHVANKDEILDGIVDLVLNEVELPSGGDWKSALRRNAVSTHEVLRRHPWACNLAMTPARIRPVQVRRADWMLARLREGLPSELTYHGFHALDSHIMGFTLWEQGHSITAEDLPGLAATFFRMFPPDEYPHLAEHAEQHLTGFGRGRKGAFELVLDLILDGLERMRDAA